MSTMLLANPRLALPLLALCHALVAPSAAAQGPAQFPPAIATALRPLLEEYGPDAVNLQGRLLEQAIKAGSLLEASATIRGFEDRGRVRVLTYVLDSGMVFNEPPSASARDRVRRIWADLVLPVLRHCRRLDVKADSVELEVGYRRAEFQSREQLQALLRDGQHGLERATFRFARVDIVNLANGELSEHGLAQRAQVFLNGNDIDPLTRTPPP